MHLKVGTRKSPLALWQANNFIDRLKHFFPNATAETICITTSGDKTKDSLHDVGGKGLFSKELHLAMERGDIDVAVHSLKDIETVPCATSPFFSSYVNPGIQIAAVWQAGSCEDVLIYKEGCNHSNLLIGTDSLRRGDQIKKLIPGSKCLSIRGNIHTRLRLLLNNTVGINAVILSKAALERLGFLDGDSLIGEFCSLKIKTFDMVPSAGQGVLAVDTLKSDLCEMLKPLSDEMILEEAWLERRILQLIEGSCHTSVGLKSCAKGVRWFYHGRDGFYERANESQEIFAQKVASILKGHL